MKSYFNRIPNCPKLLSKSFMKDDPEEAVLPEIYFNFLSNIESQLEMVDKTLENSDLSVLETYKQMKLLSSKIQQKRKDNFFFFFGSRAKELINGLCMPLQKKVTEDLNSFYSNMLQYLQKRYDVTDDNPYASLAAFSLQEGTEFKDFEKAIEVFQLSENVCIDDLCEEFSSHRDYLCNSVNRYGDYVENWLTFLSSVPEHDVPNISKVVGFLFSIPGSNAFVEQIFSFMKSKWSDTRNRCSTDLIKAELQVTVNYESKSCSEFCNFSKGDVQLLKSANSSVKYN
ncbi:hypothetical protein B7P43_G15218 [Cryptotermes secundus]|uniref:HAT C-terminal dimerisation domain-containing protein n=1 Tax=Cryptotermes secundus TaxID=105785 RepID=A0A2J7QD09_9NEOP|nr:hypothetical protein B7P43_G15218 [Cryptotermes secundus]